MTLVHIHLLLNHWPIIGAFIGLGLFVIALAANNDDLKQTSLAFFVFLALLAIPTYMSGDVANEVLKTNEPLPRELVNTHRGAAITAKSCGLSTFCSRSRRTGRSSREPGRAHPRCA